MLAAVPSGENLINRNSKTVKKTGKTKVQYQELILIITFLLTVIITAKNKERTIIKIIAGTSFTTVAK